MIRGKYCNIAILVSCLFIALSSCKSNKSETEHIPESSKEKQVPSAEGITDLILIYDGLDTRPAWNKENIGHYVYRESNGKPEWLFDGFLFLEIWANIDGVMYDYRVDNEGKVPAGKAQWEFLINKFFKEGDGVDGIEKALERQARKGFYPPYKRQVVFCIPTPQPKRKDWGSIGNKPLDFSMTEDRIKAVEWYVNRIKEEWKKKNYKHIDFGGFYWLHERIEIANGDGDLVRGVKKLLAKEDIPLCWIPYYGAEGSAQWSSFDFDIAYQQPNYFFRTDTPMEIITGALQFAKNHHLALEMEFDSRVEQPEFRERFYTYLEEFEKADVWNSKPVAYYDGADGWLKLATSSNEEMKKMHKALGDILVKRQGKFSKIINKE